MKTSIEKQKEIYYQLVEYIHREITKANDQARHLGIETRLSHFHLYKEQVEQIEEIQAYFKKVGMPSANMTEDQVLTMALKHFHQFIKTLENT